MSDIQIDGFAISDFLTLAECERILREMQAATGVAASLSGGAKVVDPYVRNVLCAEVSPELIDLAAERLLSAMPRIEERFGVKLTEIEEPQFLHYRPGDHFVAHQDGNTPRSEERRVGKECRSRW